MSLPVVLPTNGQLPQLHLRPPWVPDSHAIYATITTPTLHPMERNQFASTQISYTCTTDSASSLIAKDTVSTWQL